MAVQLVSVQEAAGQLSVHEDTVRRMIERGQLASVRVGRAVRIEQSELEALVRRSRPRRVAREEPETISDGQRRALHARAGAIDRALELARGQTKQTVLASASEQFGRAIVSANDLTAEEASWVLDRLEEALDQL